MKRQKMRKYLLTTVDAIQFNSIQPHLILTGLKSASTQSVTFLPPPPDRLPRQRTDDHGGTFIYIDMIDYLTLP